MSKKTKRPARTKVSRNWEHVFRFCPDTINGGICCTKGDGHVGSHSAMAFGRTYEWDSKAEAA